MSWVLILSRTEGNAWPAVIGGYGTQEEAESAGRAALTHPTDYWAPRPFYDRFSVIPGAANSSGGCTHGSVLVVAEFSDPEGPRWIVKQREVRYP